MPSTRYTRIEITPNAYRALEAEAILQGKTLKRLASELIVRGVSKKALDFVSEDAASLASGISYWEKDIEGTIKKIGRPGTHIDESILTTLSRLLRESGYQKTMLHVAQHTASIQRDELHRVLTICEQDKIPPEIAAEIVKSLNDIEEPLSD